LILKLLVSGYVPHTPDTYKPD